MRAEEFACARAPTPNKSVREERIVCDLKSRDNYVKRAINSAVLSTPAGRSYPVWYTHTNGHSSIWHQFHVARISYL